MLKGVAQLSPRQTAGTCRQRPILPNARFLAGVTKTKCSSISLCLLPTTQVASIFTTVYDFLKHQVPYCQKVH